MSERSDDREKSEAPTARRLAQARSAGLSANAQEVSDVLVLLAFALVIWLVLPGLLPDVAALLAGFLSRAHEVSLDGGHGLARAESGLGELVGLLALPLLILIAAGLAAAFLQSGFVFNLAAIKPRFSNIGLQRRLQRLFSQAAIVALVKGIAKLAIVGLAVALAIWSDRDQLTAMASLEMGAFLARLHIFALKVLVVALAALGLLAALDFLYQRHRHRESLSMTRQEIRDEIKESEGDPRVKARRNQGRDQSRSLGRGDTPGPGT